MGRYMKKWRDVWALFIVVLFITVFFYRQIFLGQVFYCCDNLLINIPSKLFLLMRCGEISCGIRTFSPGAHFLRILTLRFCTQ
jgi:hypothetical protein